MQENVDIWSCDFLLNLYLLDEVTRDYVPNITDSDRRKALLLPWIPCDLKHISYQQSDPGPKYFSVCMLLYVQEH